MLKEVLGKKRYLNNERAPVFNKDDTMEKLFTLYSDEKLFIKSLKFGHYRRNYVHIIGGTI